MKRALLTLSAVFATACGGAQPITTTPVAKPAVDRTKMPEPKARKAWAPPAVETFTLANGVAVWLVEQPQAPLVSLKLVLPRGAATDPVEKAGLADLMVDLLDEGAGTRDALTLSEAFQRIATDYGASAGTDAIYFSLNLLADQLSPSLALLSDIVLRPKLPQAEFDRRKAQRLARALATEARPQSGASVVMRRALFGQGYGGNAAGGVQSTLKTLTLDDVKARYAALIKPEGAAFIVVGAVNRATLEPALNAAFGDWKGAPTLTAPAVAEAGPRAIYFVDYPGTTQSTVMMVRRVAGNAAAKDYFAAKVFNWALGGAFTSRLNLNLREDKGYTYGARASLMRWQEAGVYLMYAAVKADTTRASIDEMINELRAMGGDKPLTEAEYGQAIGGMLLGFPGRFERLESVANQLAEVRADGFDPAWFRAWPENLGKVTLADARAAAKAHVDPTAFSIVIAGDWAKVGPTLAGLDLPVLHYNAQGERLAEAPAPKKAPGSTAKGTKKAAK